jgi:hypothetical protein
MIVRLISVFLAFHVAAAAAFATNITGQTGRDSGEDRIAVLRGMAEILIKESRERITLSEGEELVVKPGKTREPVEIDPARFKEQLARLGDAVQLSEVPETLKALMLSQGEVVNKLQDNFKSLIAAGSVTEEQRTEFFKNVERQMGTIAEDNLILSGLQIKINTALSDPGISSSEKTLLASYSKMLRDTQKKVQEYQNEFSKMGKTQFRVSSPSEDLGKQVSQVQEESAQVWSEVDGIMRQLSAKPDGQSQDFFLEAAKTVNDTLADISELVQKVQALLAANPGSVEAQALLKQLSNYQTQAGRLMRDLAVVPVDTALIVQAQDVKDQLDDASADLKRRLDSIKARDKEDVSKEEIEALFLAYDKTAALAEKGQELQKTLSRMSGSKFVTAEQRELMDLLAGISDAFSSLGGAAAGLTADARESVWAEYLKEKEEPLAAAAEGGPQLELGNDVNSQTLNAAPTLASRLRGAVIADVLKKDSVYYGAALMNLGASSIGADQAADHASLKQADLVVFKVENGVYSSVNLGSFQVYDGAAHAALAVNSSGELAVFLNNTLVGERNMSGAFFTLDRATLAQLNSHVLDLPSDSGWFPRLDADGGLLSLYTDGNLGEYQCADAVCDLGALLEAGAFAAGTEALRAWHSGGAYSRDDYSGDLPTEVLAGRLSGEAQAEQLGGYSHLSWGRWNDGAGVADTIHTNSHWLAGSLTPDAEVPVTGGATYLGQVFGKLNEAGTLSAVTGSTALAADFAARTLTGIFDMKKDGVDWTLAAVNASWGAGANAISGSLTADNNMKGAVNGNFFGPAAAQVGGSWNLSNGSDVRAAGVFTGDQPVAQ